VIYITRLKVSQFSIDTHSVYREQWHMGQALYDCGHGSRTCPPAMSASFEAVHNWLYSFLGSPSANCTASATKDRTKTAVRGFPIRSTALAQPTFLTRDKSAFYGFNNDNSGISPYSCDVFPDSCFTQVTCL
jgi:hypothetical protein